MQTQNTSNSVTKYTPPPVVNPLPCIPLETIFRDFSNNESAAIYVDGSNLHCSAKEVDLKIDYKTLKETLEMFMTIKSLNYFASLPGNDYNVDDIYCQGHKLVKWLANHGWRTHTNEATVSQTDGGKFRIVKANVDTDLAATAVDDIHCSKDNISRIVLMTGDKDFTNTVKILRKYARVTVISAKKTLAPSLKEVADDVIYLDDLKVYIDDRRFLQSREALHEKRND